MESLTPMRWVGLRNYSSLLTDGMTRAALLHTLEYIGGYLPLVYAGGLGLAVVLEPPPEGPQLLPLAVLHSGRHQLGSRRTHLAMAAQSEPTVWSTTGFP